MTNKLPAAAITLLLVVIIQRDDTAIATAAAAAAQLPHYCNVNNLLSPAPSRSPSAHCKTTQQQQAPNVGDKSVAKRNGAQPHNRCHPSSPCRNMVYMTHGSHQCCYHEQQELTACWSRNTYAQLALRCSTLQNPTCTA
jgi:hypothetical protein